MDQLNIHLRSLILTFCVVFIHVRLLKSQVVRVSQNPTTPLTSQPFLIPLLQQNGLMFPQQLVIPPHLYLFFQFQSQLVYKIDCQIFLWTLDSIVFQKCWIRYASRVVQWKVSFLVFSPSKRKKVSRLGEPKEVKIRVFTIFTLLCSCNYIKIKVKLQV